MKKIFVILLGLFLLFSLVACSNSDSPSESENDPQTSIDSSDSQVNSDTNTSSENGSGSTASDSENKTENDNLQTDSDVNVSSPNGSDTNNSNTENDAKILVAFFSRTGENYGVGVIEKGNTHIIADMIAEEMNADTFEIVRVTPYPETYQECTDEAQEEKSANARPELTAAVENFDGYDIVFLGYPNWWGDMPMPVYTFIESYDFSGKTVIPFCTHAGSGLSGTVETLRGKLSDSTVLDGLAIAGTITQNDQSSAKETVLSWLDEIKAIN